MTDLRACPWWTDADQAELDVLLYAFVDAACAHRERCGVCAKGGPWCGPLREGLELILEWRRRRLMRSEAVFLRARQDFDDWQAAA